MTRQHKSQFYSSEGMRQLQAQIDELWGVVDLAWKTADPIADLLLPDGCIPVLDEKSEQKRRELDNIFLAPSIDHDADNAATTAEVAAELQPDPFQINHLGRGWYQVVDNDGKPIHESKLRKEPAQEAWQAAMTGV